MVTCTERSRSIGHWSLVLSGAEVLVIGHLSFVISKGQIAQ
ncbi:hypothetical protein GXM_05325 [Nostoc sphaeroides CCNUC1]|uniref:Uncharacterized protein n=1 Tax=Nostoc sphaeroides CCNUC1 TaxID=2653204 RepID=A0A5P8W519_9NOSO|nr:hypothetical protein GXM_05325 [Nostoc sphaeroides CCNUC1]